MASMAAASDDSDADDDECEGVAYMFDAAAATEGARARPCSRVIL